MDAHTRLQNAQKRSLRLCKDDFQARYQDSGLEFFTENMNIWMQVTDPIRLRAFWSQHSKSDSMLLDSVYSQILHQRVLLLSLDDDVFTSRCEEAKAISNIDVPIGLLAVPLLKGGCQHNKDGSVIVTIGVGVRRLRGWIHLLVREIVVRIENKAIDRRASYLRAFATEIFGQSVSAGFNSPLPDKAIVEINRIQDSQHYLLRSKWAELFIIMHELGHVQLHKAKVRIKNSAKQEFEADAWAANRMENFKGYNRDTVKSIACLFLAMDCAYSKDKLSDNYPAPLDRWKRIQPVLCNSLQVEDVQSIDRFVSAASDILR